MKSNKSLAKLENQSSIFILVGCLIFGLGVAILLGNGSDYPAIPWGMIVLGGSALNLGVITRVLAMAAKAIVEGLDGNISTDYENDPQGPEVKTSNFPRLH